MRNYRCCECKKEMPIILEINDCHGCGFVVCEDCMDEHVLTKHFKYEPDKREKPKVIGKDAERFFELVERNNKSMEERRKHLKKAIETAKRINENN